MQGCDSVGIAKDSGGQEKQLARTLSRAEATYAYSMHKAQTSWAVGPGMNLGEELHSQRQKGLRVQVEKLPCSVGEVKSQNRETTIFHCSVNAGHSKEGGGRCDPTSNSLVASKVIFGSCWANANVAELLHSKVPSNRGNTKECNVEAPWPR